MTQRIVINRPPCPLPVLARPARNWKRREEWASQTEKARPAASVAEPDWKFVQTICNLLGVKQ